MTVPVLASMVTLSAKSPPAYGSGTVEVPRHTLVPSYQVNCIVPSVFRYHSQQAPPSHLWASMPPCQSVSRSASRTSMLPVMSMPASSLT